MTSAGAGRLRSAKAEDSAQLVSLWARSFEAEVPLPGQSWRDHARDWFARQVDEAATLPSPRCRWGRRSWLALSGLSSWASRTRTALEDPRVRLANLVTVPAHRGRGFGTALVTDVLGWARLIGADRVDLSATPDGQRLYEELGFELTSALA